MENKNAENKKKEYTGMTAEVIKFNKDDIIATSGCGGGGGQSYVDKGDNLCDGLGARSFNTTNFTVCK